ncbi:hypothetical protein F5X99DRAFT_410054 [Biscogniauxia marginata]|nr:hypothetical protein F5X99DRAFT_410054 [Biscogniauxia marginata]
MWLPRFLLGLSLFRSILSSAQNEDVNRALVERYVSLLNAGEYDALIDLFTSPESTYWLNGSPARTGVSGNSTVAERIGGYGEFFGTFDNFSLTLTSIAADGDLAMMEGLGRGQGPGTLLYLQTVVWVFRAVDDQLDSMREYLDFQETQYLVTYLERFAQLSATS